MQKTIVVSFSGGRTSAFMCRVIQEHPNFADMQKLFVFSNTGKELEPTLKFVDRCDKEFGLNLVWLEAKVNPEKGQGTTYTITNFEEASRNGEPFEAVVKKYGLPSKQFPHCTRELKQRPIKAFLKDLAIDYKMAIGIRADERHRINYDNKQWGDLIYPLADLVPVSLQMVIDWWKKQAFDLELKTYEGNCDLCWKKSRRKRLTLLLERPELAQWWNEMELKYGQGQYIFDQREGLSIIEQIELSKKPFRKAIDDAEPKAQAALFEPQMDLEWACTCSSN